MNGNKNFYLFLAAIPAIAAIAAACNLAGIRTHFYLWELLLDGKTIAIAALYFLLLRPSLWRNEAQELGVFRWSIVKIAGAFLIPAVLSGAIVGAGLLAKKVGYADPDNAATMLLTLAFDIPAIFIFSVTTVFIEEYVFRGCILTEFDRKGMAGAGLLISSVLWAIYAFVEVLPLEEFSWMTIGILFLFYVSVGIASGALYVASRSVWISYAFRVGVMTIMPSVISGAAGETDAFFSTENIFFLGDGIIASAALIVIFVSMFYIIRSKRKNQGGPAPAVK
jgi:membrane protease YdiL (CAAX protease family)